jgi:lysophospholipase L1-like esterase
MNLIITKRIQRNDYSNSIVFTVIITVLLYFSLFCNTVVHCTEINNKGRERSSQSIIQQKKTLKSKQKAKIWRKTTNKLKGRERSSQSITQQKKTLKSKQKAKIWRKTTNKFKRSKIRLTSKFVPIEEVINYENNIIGNDAVLTNLFKKLKETKEGNEDKIIILHIGDSHIQSGVLTGIVRENLQSIYGNAGRGLICPYSLARTNGPKDYKIMSDVEWTYERIVNKSLTLPIGVCGITIKSDDPNANINITLNHPENMNNNFNKIKILHEKGFKSRDFLLLDSEGNNIGTIDSDYSSSTFSDFISSAKFDHPLNMMTMQSFQKDNRQTYAQIYGFVLENNKPGILYDTVGINGATYSNYYKEIFIQQAVLLNPDLIIISLGTNESFSKKFDVKEFISNIDRLTSAFKKELPTTNIILTVPPDSLRGRRKNWNIPTIRSAMISYCKNNDFAYWDLFSVMGGTGSILKWQANKLASKDHIHFLTRGYELQGKLFFDALIKSYNNHAAN